MKRLTVQRTMLVCQVETYAVWVEDDFELEDVDAPGFDEHVVEHGYLLSLEYEGIDDDELDLRITRVEQFNHGETAFEYRTTLPTDEDEREVSK